MLDGIGLSDTHLRRFSSHSGLYRPPAGLIEPADRIGGHTATGQQPRRTECARRTRCGSVESEEGPPCTRQVTW